MDLTAAQTELKARGGDYLSNARLTTFLNDAKSELEDYWDWPWLETTTSGAAPLTIADLKSVLYVVDTSNLRELRGLAAADIVAELDETITTTGTPEYWWLDGTTSLKLYPASTSAQLSVRYVKFSAELSAGTDTPLIPTRYHNLWIDLAMVRVYKDDDQAQAAAALLQDCYARLYKIVEVYEARNHQNPMIQRVRFASEDW
jgi:hypothetical protein